MKILIVKTSSLGDVVQTFPVINYLRHIHPDCEIHWVAEKSCATLLEAHPEIQCVIPIDTKAWRRALLSKPTWHAVTAAKKMLQGHNYDVVFDLQGNVKSAVITWLARSPVKVGFNRAHAAEWPNTLATNRHFGTLQNQNVRMDYLQVVQQYFQDQSTFKNDSVRLNLTEVQKRSVANTVRIPMLDGRQKVLVCPGSIWRNKQVPPKVLLEFLQRVQQTFPASFLFSWGSEEERLEAQSIANQLTHSAVTTYLALPALQNLMHNVDLVLAMDSLPLHLAGTTSTPTFSFFGPSMATKYAPEGHRHEHFQGACPYGKTFEKRCPILRTCSTGACLRTQPTDKLFAAFGLWWEKIGS